MTKEQILNTGIAELLNKYKKELLLILGFYTLNSEEVINGKNKKIRVAEFNPLGSQNVILSIIQKMIKKDKLKNIKIIEYVEILENKYGFKVKEANCDLKKINENLLKLLILITH